MTLFKCIINIQNINKYGQLYSACFVRDNYQVNIVTSNYNYYHCEYIKIFNLNALVISQGMYL